MDLRLSGGFEHLPSELETALYRTLQEALTNIERHARASRTSVCLCMENASVVMCIEDDGVGSDASSSEKRPSGIGLKNMKERAGLLDGRLSVRSEPGVGTTLEVRLPLHSQTGAADG